MPQLKRKNPAVCDVFAGVGGLSLGAARAGFRVAAAVENDVHAITAHHRNFPKTEMIAQDVSTLSGGDLLNLAGIERGGLSGLIGGPPCQGFSSIGKQQTTDPRNLLFAHFFRLVSETQPLFFVAENVQGILGDRNAKIVDSAMVGLRRSYSILEPIVLNASDYGVPTIRTRVFFVGIRRELATAAFNEALFGPPKRSEQVVVRDALRGLPGVVDGKWHANPQGLARRRTVARSTFLDSMSGRRPTGVGEYEAVKLLEERDTVTGHKGTEHSAELQRRYGMLRPGASDPITKSVRLVRDGFCPTLRAGTTSERGSFQAVRPIHYKYPRVITPREAARLQSFPDWFVFDETKWHSFRQIGNSVPPLLAQFVLSKLYPFVG